MSTRRGIPGLLVALLVASWAGQALPVRGQEPLDTDLVVEMRREGLERSEVMKLASVLSDVYGPRYANSPSYDAAAEWAKRKLEEFGLEQVKLEPWGEFGYSWQNTYTSVHMMSPRYQPIIGYSMPGCRGTGGRVRSAVTAIDVSRLFDSADLEAYRGELEGKIVLVGAERLLTPNFAPQAVRLSDEELRGMARLEIDRLAADRADLDDGEADDASHPQPLSAEEVEAFFDSEGVAVLIEPGSPNVGPMDKGVVHVSGSDPLPLDEAAGVPTVVVAAEHYNRMMRLLDQGIAVEMEVEVRNACSADDPLDYNVLAELPGGDLAEEVVMIGGHLDAEPAGTGAADNASGSAIVMEAMRILKTVGAQPRRTIRAALWGAEEVELLGSRGYVQQHFVDPQTGEHTAEFDNFSVYFNVDWYGRFRGIFLQGNDATQPIFATWMKPFEDIGMEWIVPGNTGSTDHIAFLEAGLPGFQFIQDDLEFFNVTFHTNMDVYDRLVGADLKQAAVILASFAYHAAMRDEKFPRADGIHNGRRWHK